MLGYKVTHYAPQTDPRTHKGNEARFQFWVDACDWASLQRNRGRIVKITSIYESDITERFNTVYNAEDH